MSKILNYLLKLYQRWAKSDTNKYLNAELFWAIAIIFENGKTIATS